jgi:ABC-type uncharacterized transport system permease subunit
MNEKNRAMLKSAKRLPKIILFCLDKSKGVFFLVGVGFVLVAFFAMKRFILGAKLRIYGLSRLYCGFKKS